MKARVILLSGLCSLLAVAGDPADEHTKSATKDESVLHVETRLVEVNVVAQDSKGNAITDLTRDDFNLLDNGKKVPIDVFSAISIGTEPKAPNLPQHTFSNRVGLPTATVILLDGLNTAVEDQTWARSEVISFLEKLEPQDRVAIFLLGDHLYVLQNFTSDPKVLLEVLKTTKPRVPKELAASTPPAPTPGSAQPVDLNTALDQLQAGLPTGPGGTTGASTGTISGAAETSAQAAEEGVMMQFEGHEGSFFVVDRAGRTVDALLAIGNYLAQFPGRKNLIWVSASFPVGTGFDTPRQPGDTRDQIQFTGEVKRAVKALNNADLAIYPVDARGLVAGGVAAGATSIAGRNSTGSGLPDANNFYSTRGIMEELADDTGGRAFYNTNDLAGVIRHAVDDTRANYTLGFYPHIRWDGTYHDLKVKVNRPGVHLRFRKGYYASLVASATEDQVSASLTRAISSPLETTGLGLTVSIEQRVEKPARRLKLNITADAHNLTFQDKKGGKAASLDFIFAQLDTEGKVVSDVRHTVSLGVAEKGIDVVMERGLSMNDLLEVTPGATQLRLVVRDTASGNMGSVTVPLGP